MASEDYVVGTSQNSCSGGGWRLNLPGRHTRFDRNCATRITVSHAGGTILIRGRAIILPAGAIGSRPILQLPGIGPADLLQSLRIKLCLDAPIDQHLQGRLQNGCAYRILGGKKLNQVAWHGWGKRVASGQ